MIKVLHVVSALDNGGVEKMLKDYQESINKKEFTFDFIIHDPNKGSLESFFIMNGSKIFRVVPKKRSFLKNFQQIKAVINENEYDIIHCHQNLSSFVPLYIGFLKRIRVRIAHSHVFIDKQKKLNKIIEWPQKKIIKLLATEYFAASKEAGEWLFGKENKKIYIMNNAINISDFKYNENARSSIREQYSLGNQVVLGHVGRFVHEKNHEFLITILKEIKLMKENVKLLLIGNGETEDQIKEQILEYNLSEDVVIVSETNEVSKFYSAMDLFLFPSKYEGFGRVLLEAQTSGLKCIANDTISRETNISDNVTYISTKYNKEDWIEEIIEKINQKVDRRKLQLEISRYEIENATIDLERKYCSLIK